MSVTPKSGKHGQGVGECSESASPSPLAGSGPGGHKASFRSTKLARRARSFKEDFLEKISQMRSPPGSVTTAGGAGSGGHARPHSPRTRHTAPASVPSCATADKSPTRDIELMVRQVQVALKHFRDVVSKDKLEMLHGNGTIVLDTVLSILSALRPLVGGSGEQGPQSATLGSACSHVHQSLARLIKLCDDVLLNGHQSAALAPENVAEVVGLLEGAVQQLVRVAHDKLQRPTAPISTLPGTATRASCLELPAQRNSLPDIPLTPRERQILEQTSGAADGAGGASVRSSHSTESVLRGDSPTPPPKPPLPAGLLFSVCLSDTDSPSLGSGTPPPLPPKKRSFRAQQLIGECCTSDSSLLGCSLDRVSYRSRSPEDSSSLLSASAGSLDSVLNHSREEEEIRALMGHAHTEEGRRENDLADISCNMHGGTNGNCLYDDTFCAGPTCSTLSNLNHISDLLDSNRLSNTDSGFVSIHSHRNSVQSYTTSKRSSQQSSSSQHSTSQWSSQHSATTTTTSTQWTASQQNSSFKMSTSSASDNLVHKSESIIENLEHSVVTASSQHSSLSSSQMSDLSVVQSLGAETQDVVDQALGDEVLPPAIPQKTKSRRGRHERQPSPYDNVPLDNIGGELIPCSMHQSQTNTISSTTEMEDVKPPPLPAKKRHIMAYMEMFGNCSHSSESDFLRHSVHMVQAQWQNQQSLDSGLTTTQSCSFMHTHTTLQHISPSRSPGAAPTLASLGPSPNNYATLTSPIAHSTSLDPPTEPSIPPALPPKRSRGTKLTSASPPPPLSPTLKPPGAEPRQNHSEEKLLKPEIKSTPEIISDRTEPRSSLVVTSTPVAPHKLSPSELSSSKNSDKSDSSDVLINNDLDLMEELDVSKYIILKKSEEDGPDIRGGYVDALIVQATKTNKKDFSYQEAFLTTYRTFISPYDLVTKLIRRHQYFICQPERKPRAREAFALLVRVVNDLTVSDLEESLVQAIMDFIYQLISSGNLAAAKPLRVTLIEKYNAKLLLSKMLNVQATLSLVAACATLLEFKSEQIAEQMTLLDANLFMKIEIPEVLIWAQEQNEERSPNLTRFTEHFNKMSYWARTKILQSEAKDREKYVMKFIKIMKHLRKINNFNSYLALLSALDSAPIRRLEWQKHITEGLKEYCALIDSSSSFRAYRQALAETSPPCIPYIGLVLQDLTFVHIGNSNLLADGTINFSKRWQQFNIVENMKRFKKCSYTFKKNERIIAFFRNFDDFIGEDAMWQISESIKPRGGKKATQ